MDPRTTKRYAESPQKPEYTLSKSKPRKMGFERGCSIVKAYVSSWEMGLNEKATVRFKTMPGKQGQVDWRFFEDHAEAIRFVQI